MQRIIFTIAILTSGAWALIGALLISSGKENLIAGYLVMLYGIMNSYLLFTSLKHQSTLLRFFVISISAVFSVSWISISLDYNGLQQLEWLFAGLSVSTAAASIFVSKHSPR